MTPEERMDDTRCRNKIQSNHLVNIRGTGFSILSVFEDGETPGWSYTIGLWHNYKHPEVLVIGLQPNLSSKLLNILNSSIRDESKRFDDGSSASDVLAGYLCHFRKVPVEKYDDWVLGDEWFYGGKDFPVVQMLWPDTSGVYPWSEEANESLRRDQPILTALP